MRKRIVAAGEDEATSPAEGWLDLDQVAEVEVTSEDSGFPVEGALLPGHEVGWRAARPGEQRIRLLFPEPQRLSRIVLEFVEPATQRTQEFVLRWSAVGEDSLRDIVRQQWNFSPQGSNRQVEDVSVDLADVAVLELVIVPDISGGDGRASLESLRLA
jgi:hypothetical protein